MTELDHRAAADLRGWPLQQAVRLADLGPLAEPVSENNGQAVAIRPLSDHPGWLAKIYRPGKGPEDARRLDLLISAPSTLPDADRATLYAGSCWPAARIFEPGNPVHGCVIPVAPEHFRGELRRAGHSERRFVEIDWLAKPDESIQRIGLPRPGHEGRLAACDGLTALAAILEKLSLVYSDWSFSNAFWSPNQRSVYLIDIDGCRLDQMPDIHQPNWADPLTPQGTDADRYTDRYRLGLLTAKCLTGLRNNAQAFHAVSTWSWPSQPALPEVLLDMLLATDREQRPSAAQLRNALSGGPYLRPVPRPVRAALPELPPGMAPSPQPGAVAAAPNPGPLTTSPKPDQPSERTVLVALVTIISAMALIVLLCIVLSQ